MSDVRADDDSYVDFKGWRFTAPFRCLGCGSWVSIEQFCFGRACGACDCGREPHGAAGLRKRRASRRCYSGPRQFIGGDEPILLDWMNDEAGLTGIDEEDARKQEWDRSMRELTEETRAECKAREQGQKLD